MPNPENLIPITSETAAELGAKGGRNKKGSQHLSTIIQRIGENIDWDKTNLKSKDELNKKYGKKGFDALVYVAFSKALSGDTKAMDWLAKHGFGEKLKIEVDDPRKEILKQYLGGSDAGQTPEAQS